MAITGTVTSSGTNIDIDTIVSKMMAIEQTSVTKLQTQASALQSQVSAVGTVKSMLSTLSDAATALTKPTLWATKTASSSSAAVGVKVADSSQAMAGSFQVSVSQLARSQSVSSSAVAATDGFQAGTLSIQIGTWSGTSGGGTPSFAAGSAAAVDVAISAGDTLGTVASKINAAGAGVTASVVTDLSGQRLVMRSASTGEAAGFQVSANGSGSGTALSGLAFDAPGSGAGMAANSVQWAANSVATVDGVTVTSATNTVTGALPGLSLTLSQLSSDPVTVTTSTDTNALTSAIQGFVNAYNNINGQINSLTSYNADTKKAGLMQGDSMVTGLQTMMRRLVGTANTSGTFTTLSQLGISVSKSADGSLTLDSTKLGEVLANPDAVKTFFMGSGDGTTSTTDGWASRFSAFTKGAVGDDGTLDIRTQSLQKQLDGNTDDQAKATDRMTLTESRLRAQYSALDAKLSTLTSLDTYVKQQIAQWNKSS
ncbi:flagellar filament capping protein FliD [Pseudacidovorax sp. RU35E]|uniref:flagellar filament capping protein FliD n=1 Tax=Pseudacidovorax sp. RU35E TaxID=1907403 RepID=UPI0009547068|nr:flagellar filament capping protein FliD [Pseudacidovorax sp. RU35E]SIQ14871.1 flagellar hook-associated protein 2 [Pseudacidovorax sp. RU35E]